MRKITNREEANQYYKQINEVIDEYIKDWKIRPTEVYHYFKRNMNSFLEEIGLSDVIGIHKVVEDVLTHKRNIELDAVLTFESFNSLDKLEYEKVLGDFFQVGLGHIDIVDSNNNIFRVKDFGESKFVACYSKSDILDITEEVVNELMEITVSRMVSIPTEEMSVKFFIEDIVDKDKLRNKLMSEVKTDIFKLLEYRIKKNESIPLSSKIIKREDLGNYLVFYFC